ncbi:nucleotidyltransferase domain-containing protein [Sulfurihydrogenibium sp.]|uniref:nucleotidyltransferase family protein n=1 Tax=Sulfurihydrogenibium sp. TaxID=2053621 RepID=UPI002627132E|nr:nucleotidyltransferase domain-containing protein [Sulfurihydrogenibium sp.]
MYERTVKLSYKDGIVDEIINQIIDILKKYIKTPFKLYIFGSFATGNATIYSDLDLALETEENLDKKTLFKIKEDIENIKTLRKIDFLYLNQLEGKIKETVKKEGIKIYEFTG